MPALLDVESRQLAYRAAFVWAYDLVHVAVMTTGRVDVEAIRRELARFLDMADPDVREGVDDALAGRPSRW
jgi:hypothetical protein